MALNPLVVWPVLSLLFNAFVWGLSWWPLRQMQSYGLHPLWATVLIFAACALVLGLFRPRAVSEALGTPSLWVLMLAAGATNAAFNWAVSIGDVVRVVLLFYLAPLWTVLFARLLLQEELTRRAALQIGLALVGAAVVLWPESQANATFWQRLPLPRSFPDFLGVLGGMSFALNNVMLRREAKRGEAARAWAMFFGGVLVAGALALVLTVQGQMPALPAMEIGWLLLASGLMLTFLISNMALQYGAARLPSHVTAVVMTSEVVFATVSATLWGAGVLTAQAWIGGGAILLAALLSSIGFSSRSHHETR